jgi:purine-nucleoside/S-methyl-5'-thioadenosine phosphorylase / adenosine deaminase
VSASVSLAPPARWRTRDGVGWIEVSLPGAVAAFGTRIGGVSEGHYSALNLGVLTDDRRDRVERNRELFAGAIGRDPRGIAMGRQVHGSALRIHRGGDPSAYAERVSDLPEADGQLTDDPGVTPLVLTADCFPLVLSAPGAVAAVHCGWRGVAAGIVTNAVEEIGRLARGMDDVAAAIGPGIGPCCYAVGAEVAQAFAARGDARPLDEGRLDIAEAITRELIACGVQAEAIAGVGLCTSCNPELFYSHRRDGGVTGRQAGVAWLSL